MTPPATVDELFDTAAELPSPVAVAKPARTELPTASSRRADVGASSERVRNTLFFAAWTPAFVLASAVGVLALAVALPIMVARGIYEERHYR
jgi:hypothetical protein